MFGKRKADTRRWPMLQGRWVHSICHQLQTTCNGKVQVGVCRTHMLMPCSE